MQLLVIGLNHRTAPVAVRERLAFGPAVLPVALEELATARPDTEWTILSTCNRTEVYLGATAPQADTVRAFLARRGELSEAQLAEHLYEHRDREMVHHLFRVASGLDSQVLGETEVLGQVKRAFEAARSCATLGPLLERLLQTGIAVGKRVRTETALSRGAFSVGHCAVELAEAVFGDLHGYEVLVLGAGEMAEAVARHLVASGASSVLVANRTYERAVKLAEELGGRAIRYDDLMEALERCHVVISSTAAPHVILTREQVMAAMRARRNAPLFLIDIAVPRDIEPSVGDLENVYLFNIDDLEAVVERNRKARQREVERGEVIVQAETEHFMEWFGSRRVLPTIAALRQKAEDIRQAELERSRPRLAMLSEEAWGQIEQMTQAIVNKLLHEPTAELRRILSSTDSEARLQVVRELFGLSDAASSDETPHQTAEHTEPSDQAASQETEAALGKG